MGAFTFKVDSEFMLSIAVRDLNEALKIIRDTYSDAEELEIRDCTIECDLSSFFEFKKIAFVDCKIIDIGINRKKSETHLEFHYCYIDSMDIKNSEIEFLNISNCFLKNSCFIGNCIQGVSISYTYASYFIVRNSKIRRLFMPGTKLVDSIIADSIIESIGLKNADISGTKFHIDEETRVEYNYKTNGYAMACPEKGAFIAYKKCYNSKNGMSTRIVTLLIPEDAKRSSGTSAKCRCSKAMVLKIEDEEGREHAMAISMLYDGVYEKGKMIEVEDFNENRWNECSTGIHFFMDKGMALEY